ncbi:MAG: sugar transferase [Desulfobulbaceae bacterium]|nr:sugar transferase [Desulfobulbaceae bacterium]
MKSFFKSPDKKKKYILICGDIFVLCLGLLAGFFINFMKSGGVSTFIEALPNLTLLPIILALVNISLLFLSVASLLSTIYAVTAYVVGAFDIDIVFNKKQNVINIALAVALSMLINFAVINVIFDQFFDKYIWLFFVLFTFSGVVSWRKIFYNNFIISDPYNILIIDPDKLAKKASLLLTNGKHNIFHIAEIAEEEFFAKYLFFDNKDGWRKYNLIVFPFLTNLSNDHMISLVKTKFWGVSTCSSLTFYIHSTGSIPVFDIGPNKLIDLSVTLALSNPLQRRIKRVGDILFSLCGFVITFPVMIIVAGLIKATSSGPVLFRQERLGLHEKPFMVYKFRTMKVNAEKDTGPVWAKKGDPRVTPIGGFLRKSRLDELPQFYNVFKGEMSFVGPRPIRHFFADKLSRDFPFYFLRFYIKPGLTGWAQVSGDYGDTIEGQLQKLQYELFYLQEYTLFLDAVIILKTIKKVVWAKGQ